MRRCECWSKEKEPTFWLKDAMGIELRTVCSMCVERVKAGYPEEIFDPVRYREVVEERIDEGDA